MDEITFINQQSDISTGRYPNGTGSFDEMSPTLAEANVTGTGVADNGDTSFQQPQQFVFNQNYPNPFNPVTSIHYSLPNSAKVELAVFNLQGQRVKTLISGIQSTGNYEIVWDGTNENGMLVTSGIYLYQMKAGNQRKVKKMSLVR